METQEKVVAIGQDDAQSAFHDFLESVTYINATVQEENTTEEVERIEEELDALFDIAEDVYCELTNGDRSLPENYSDFHWAVANESERCGVPEEEIWQIVDSVEREYIELSPRRAWKEVLSRVQRERRMRRCIQGHTTPSDWQ